MTGKTEERHAQLELCIPYVFGRLNPGNRKQFEAHLVAGCEQCRVELSGLYESTALLPLLLRQEAPPSGVRQKLLGRLSSKKPEQRRNERPQPPQREKPVTPSLAPSAAHDRPWYLYVSIVGGALLIIALIIFVNQLVGTTGSQEKKLTELQGELQRSQEAAGILQAERLEILPLTSVMPGSGMYGKVLWDPAKRNAVLQTANLPAQSEGKQYQLWILKEKKPYSVGVFDVNVEKSSTLNSMVLPVADTREIEGFSITLEPKGGSPQPTGDALLKAGIK